MGTGGTFSPSCCRRASQRFPIACGCCPRADIYARRGNYTWRSKGRMSSKIRFTLLFLDSPFLEANVLVDRKRHARLADFGLVTIISDPAYFTASLSLVNGGTIGWMSPELLSIDNSQPNQHSDCYALGMVIYEVLGGRAPFSGCRDVIVIQRVLRGEHPERPEGERFTDDVWRTLECCWLPHPEDRPGIETILECLGRAMVATINSTLQRTIGRPSSRDELVPLLETIFSSGGSTDVPNTPNVFSFAHSSDHALTPPRKGRPHNSWDVVADHVLQVSLFSLILTGDLTLSMGDPRCCVCFGAPL